MIGLLKAEAQRWLGRRAIWATLVIGLGIVALAGLVFVLSLKPPSGADVERGKKNYAAAQQDLKENSRANYDSCVASVPEADKERCEFVLAEPQESDYIPQPMAFENGMNASAETGAILGGVLALAMAASFWGAEYRVGSLATWLTFVPNRARAWVAKTIVVVVAGALVVLVIESLLMLTVFVATMVLQGSAATAVDVTKAFQLAARGLGLGSLMALLGASIAIMLRHTVAAVVMPLAYFLIQGFSGLFSMIPGYEHATAWLPENNIRAYLEYGITYQVPMVKVVDEGMEMDMINKTLSFSHGLVYLLVFVLGSTLASFLVFRRRDVN